MIPYELIIPSSSRPHLLGPVLESLFEHVDQSPVRMIVHDDPVFPGKQTEVVHVATTARDQHAVRLLLQTEASPPVGHGPSLYHLLKEVQSKYVLYSQDDHVAVRTLPIAAALSVMENFNLNHVRFNKRATMGFKGTWAKKEQSFGPDILTVSDHWYFQTSLWRVSVIRPIVEWWMANSNAFAEHCEVKINRTLNGQVPEYGAAACVPPTWADPMAANVRAQYQRTFIWGPIGEDKYIQHIGDKIEDWAMFRPRGGSSGSDKDSQEAEKK